MIGQRFYAVHNKSLGEFLHPFTAQAIDNPRFSRIALNVFNDILAHILRFGLHLIVKVWPVERG